MPEERAQATTSPSPRSADPGQAATSGEAPPERAAAKAAPDSGERAEPHPMLVRAGRWGRALLAWSPPRWGLVALIPTLFVFCVAPFLQHNVVPYNCDEIDTYFVFNVTQYLQKGKPWEMGSTYSGMYNLTFWLRTLGYDSPDDFINTGLHNRIYSVGAGVLLLFLVYGFGRWIHGHKFGLIAMTVAAFGHYNYFLSIEGNYLHETSIVILCSLWAFLAAEKASSLWLRGLLGLVTGMGLVLSGLLYFSGRVTILALIGYAVMMQIQDRRWWRRGLPVYICILAVFAPAVREFLQDQKANPAFSSYRQTGTQILYKNNMLYLMDIFHTDSVAKVVAGNVTASFRAFGQGLNQYHSYMMDWIEKIGPTKIGPLELKERTVRGGYLDPFSFLLGLIGFGWALWNWRKPHWLLLLGIFCLHVGVLGGLTFMPQPPYHQRVHFAILLSYFFVAVPIWGLASLPGSWGRLADRFLALRSNRWLARLPAIWSWHGRAAAVGALVFITFVNSDFFSRRVFINDQYIYVHRVHEEISNYLDRLTENHDVIFEHCGSWLPGLDHHLVSHNMGLLHPHKRIIAKANYLYFSEQGRKPIGTKPLIFVFEEGAAPCPEPSIDSIIPGGHWFKLKEQNKPLLACYLPPKDSPAQPPPPAPKPASP